MRQFVCSVCGYIYDEAAGDPSQGVSQGTRWEDLPADWTCPICGADKSAFSEKVAAKPNQPAAVVSAAEPADELRELTFGELSSLCTNLAKGCEKQYRPEEAALFGQLAEYFKSKTKPAGSSQFADLLQRIQEDLQSAYPAANQAASAHADRGALRALTWSSKVTQILSSLLARFDKQQDALLTGTNVFVCEICGFVFIGDQPPEICPICKVPSFKIRKLEKEAV